VIVHAPAKINTFLQVGAVDASGYHAVDTHVHLLAFGDDVEVQPADALSLTCQVDPNVASLGTMPLDALDIAPEENLAWRAAVELGRALGCEPQVAITLTKRIPHGAGLGGGSSDAAAVIRALCTQWRVALDDERVLQVAHTLGADVPVFLAPTTFSHMSGYGDVLVESLEPLSGQPVVLAMAPGAHISTADAYRAFDTGARGCATDLHNDLAQAAISLCPQVSETLDWLCTQPEVQAAQVSGSGAACFALTETDTHAVAARATAHGLWSIATACL